MQWDVGTGQPKQAHRGWVCSNLDWGSARLRTQQERVKEVTQTEQLSIETNLSTSVQSAHSAEYNVHDVR